MKVNNNDFNEFQITGYDAFRRLCMAELVNNRSDSPDVSYKLYPPVDNIKRSIKHNPNFFPSFKDQALWENLNRNTVVTAFTQDVEDLLHEAYVPSTPDDMDLFRGKQKYMYSVFVKILLTDQGKKIVHENQSDKYT